MPVAAKGAGKPVMRASLGNGRAIAVGPWQKIAADRSGPDGSTIGGEPPTELVLLPFPEWELDDCTLITDADSQRSVVADLRRRKIDLHFDYHHQSLRARDTGVLAIAAGWIAWTSIAGSGAGLVGSGIRWTTRADAYLRAGEFRYFSPVVEYDEKTLRVLTLLSVALTNDPRSNEQEPLTAALAASLMNKRTRLFAGQMEGYMPEWISILVSLLNRLWCSEPDDLIEDMGRAMEAIKGLLGVDGTAAAETARAWGGNLPKDASVLEACLAAGLKLPDTVTRKLAASNAPALLPADALAILGLAADTTPLQFSAALVSLKTERVPRADLIAKEQELAAAHAEKATNRVDALLTTYASRITDAEIPELRRLAGANFDAVELSLKARPPLVSATVSGKGTEPRERALPASRPRRAAAVAGGDEADEVVLATNAIIAERLAAGESITYAAANELRKKRDLAEALTT